MSSAANPADLTATELAAAYAAGEVSPVEATRAALERISDHDEQVNAFCVVDGDAALAAAGESEERWRRGEARGPVDGVPTSIKDMLLARGWPTRKGSTTIDEAGAWEEDSPASARLREAGAVILGKTTTPEFGWKGVTDSPLTGITRNPWNTDLTPGGSSGGSAAAVLLGMGQLSVGTDGGGSVRIPAGFTGTFALKPTYGRVPLYPASPFGTLAHHGPMTRTVEEAGVLLDVISGPDARDWSANESPAESYADAVAAAGTDLTGLRVAYSADLGFVTVDPEVAKLVRSAVDVFAELGATVEEVDPGFSDPIEAFNVLWYSGAAKVVAGLSDSARATLDPGLAEITARGAEFSALDYLDATAVRMDLGRRMSQFHTAYDVLLTPTLPIPAFAAGVESPASTGSAAAGPRWTNWTPFTYPFNLTQQPAASVPCGFTGDGLPVGLQIVAARHADARVMSVARSFELARPWKDNRPAMLTG